MTLRPYQHAGKEALRALYRAGKRRCVYQLATGGGKSKTACSMIGDAIARGRSTRVLVHRIELVEQFEGALAGAGIDGVPVSMAQTVTRRLGRTQAPDFLVIDECFPAGTLIDGVPIEAIRVGDVVRSFDACGGVLYSHVARVMNRYAHDLLEITLENGTSVVCTKNHPILTDAGWLHAGQIAAETCKVGFDPVLGMRRAINVSDRDTVLHVEEQRARTLFASVQGCVCPPQQQRDYGAHEQAVCFGPHERAQPDAGCINAAEGIRDTAGDETCAIRARGERPSDACGSGPASVCPWPRLGGGDGRSHRGQEGQRCPMSLQSRYWECRAEDVRRGRWGVSRGVKPERTGQPEGQRVAFVGVRSVEVYQPSGSCGHERLHTVYNLEVEGTHTYFANGVAVHNCHHATSETWARIIRAWPDAWVLGLTATPARTDGRGLGELFDGMVCGPSMRQLMDDGYLARYRLYAPPAPDTTGLRKRAGDYTIESLSAVFDRPQVVGDVVDHYQRYGGGRQFVAFGVSVDHAHNLAAGFQRAGVACEVLHGKMTAPERKRIVQAVKCGALQGIANCDIVSEGFDVPAIGCVILAGRTLSLIRYLQRIGRGLRPDGNREAVILDHGGNVYIHGMPDQPREWSLDGVSKKAGQSEVVIRHCPECFAVFAGHLAACPYCGYAVERKIRTLRQQDGELVEVSYWADAPVSAARTIDDLRAIAKARGYHRGWVFHKAMEALKMPEMQARRELGWWR